MTARVAWIDCSSGVSGDMLLGALSALGAVDVPRLVADLDVDVTCTVDTVTRGGISATGVQVRPGGDQPHRRLADVLAVVDAAPVAEPARDRARRVFNRLATAEARVHGTSPHDVEFHEVGAVDAIVDVLGACVGLHALDAEIVTAPVVLGSGTTRSAHGLLPVPGPAVLELLRDAALVGAGDATGVELATPTGVAVLAEWARPVAAMPPMQVSGVGVGAGGRDLKGRPNVLRIVVGERADGSGDPPGQWLVVETNVDDLDPRLWPGVLDRLLAAGAADAWLTPILMKKGRPAHTLAALVPSDRVDAVRATVFDETSAIGLRAYPVAKTALDREWVEVDVDGQPVRVKVARRGGAVTNAAPEYDDVVRAATALGRPVKSVLAAAAAAGVAALEVPAQP